MDAVTIEKGSSYTLPTTCGFTAPAGKEFANKWEIVGWENTYAVGSTWAFDEDTTIKPVWKAISVTPPVTTYTVTFDANGHGTAPAAQTVADGNTATEPTAPTASGWTFGGWYTEAACTNKFDFNTAITGDITLYAKWTEDSVTPPVTTYTVTFKDGDSTLSTQTVNDGEKATKPADPTKDGYTFDGWYADSTFNAAFDFNMAITADTTVYAKFTKDGTDPVPVTKYTITYNLNGGTLDGKTGIIKVQAEEGSTITIPAAPTREGYKFTYWKGSEYHPGDSYKVEGDHTFTAQWEKVSSSSEGTDSGSSGGSTSDDGKKDDASQTGTTNPTGTKTPVPNTGVRAPKTGDDSHMVLWGSLMAASLLGLFLVFVLRRRYREER